MNRYSDQGSIIVIAITFVLLVAALISTGLTLDLLLEEVVLLVSTRLVLMACKTGNFFENILLLPKRINELLNKSTLNTVLIMKVKGKYA